MNVASYGFRDWIEEATDGRLQIEIVEPESIFPGTEALTAVGSGAVDCFKGSPGQWAGTMPEMNVAGGMPGTSASVGQQYVAWYDYGIVDLVQPLYDEYNLVWFPITGAENMNTFSTFDMPNPDAMKGHKVRTWGPWGKYIELTGATSVSMPYSDVYMAVKLGTVEGAWTGAQSLETIKLKEVVTDFVTNPQPCLDCFIVNKDSFNALPEDIQGLIMSDAPYFFAQSCLRAYEHQQWVVAHAAEDYGLELWTWSEEDIKGITERCVEEIWPEFAAETPLCAQIMDIIKQQMIDHGRL